MVILFILTDKQTGNNQSHTQDIHPRKMFTEEEEHKKSREDRSDIVESIGTRYTNTTNRITEQDECYH